MVLRWLLAVSCRLAGVSEVLRAPHQGCTVRGDEDMPNIGQVITHQNGAEIKSPPADDEKHYSDPGK